MRHIPLGVTGLDRVLCGDRFRSGSTDNDLIDNATIGEFVLPSEEKVFGVISGAAGAGKTLLALQIACKMLSSYNVYSDVDAPFAIYICTEERPETIKQRVIDNQFLDGDQIFIGWPPAVQDVENIRQAKLIILDIRLQDRTQAEKAALGMNRTWEGDIVELLKRPGKALDALDRAFDQDDHVGQNENRSAKTRPWSKANCLILDTLGLLASDIVWSIDDATGTGYLEESRGYNRSDINGNMANSIVTVRRRWRQLLALIKLLSQRDDFDFLCTVETNNNNDSQCLYEEAVFVANLALKISSDSGTQSSHSLRRTLEVEKARHQSVFRGPHDLTIIGPNTTKSRFSGPLFQQNIPKPGIHVNPSLACQLAYYESLADRRPVGTGRITTGIDKLDALVQRQLANKGGFEPGTSIGIIAERGAGATSLSLQFLADGYPGDDKHILMISFAHSTSILKTKIAGTSRTQGALLNGTEFKDGFHVQGNVSPSLSPERFLVCLENFLAKYKPSRLVLDSLSVLRSRYSAFTDIQLFSYALLRLCRCYGTTPLIIDTVPLVDEKGYITPEETQLQEIADNVLILAHVSLRGKPKWALMIRKTVNGVYNRGPFELVKKNDNLDVVPESFEAYADVFSGFAKYIPLRLSLYVDAENYVQGSTLGEHPYTTPLEAIPSAINGEKRLESNGNLAKLTPLTRYKHQVASAFSASLPGISVNFWGPLEHGTCSSRPNSWGEVPRPDTVVMEFDGYWISELEEGECVLSLKDALDYLERSNALSKYLRGVQSDYRIPHYVDIGMLFKRIESESDTELSHRKIPSWKDIAERVNQSATLEEWRDSAIFDFDRTTSEMLSVLFLEFAIAALRESTITPSEQSSVGVLGIKQSLFRELGTKVKNCELHLYPEGNDPDKKEYRHAIVLACTTFLSLFPFDRRIRRYLTTTKRCNANAIYQRHWYSTFGAQLARAESRRKRTSSYIVYDGLPLVADATENGSSPVVGSWHLGVAKGSASPSLGVRAILEMTTPESDLNKFVNYVGLPAGNWFYRNSTDNCFPPPVSISPSPQAIQESYLNNGFSRAWIKNYRDISFVLQLFMQELLLKPAVHEEVEKCCIKYQRMIDAIYLA